MERMRICRMRIVVGKDGYSKESGELVEKEAGIQRRRW